MPAPTISREIDLSRASVAQAQYCGGGPFLYGGALYEILATPGTAPGFGTAALQVWKSLDNGVTWAVLSGPDTTSLLLSGIVYQPPGSVDQSDRFGWRAFRSGDVIYVSHTGSSTTDYYVDIHRFDLISETWLTSFTGGPEYVHNAPSGLQPYTMGIRDTLRAIWYNTQVSRPQCVVRSDGSIVAVTSFWLNDPTSTPFMAGVRFASYSGSWGASFTMGSASDIVSETNHEAVLGASDRVHVFLLRADATLQNQTILSDDSLGTEGQVASLWDAGDSTDIAKTSVGVPGSNGSQIAIPYKGSDGKLYCAIATSADEPSWTNELVDADPHYPPGVGYVQAGINNYSIAFPVGSCWVVMWTTQFDFADRDPDYDGQIVYRMRNAGGVWGPQTLWRNPTQCGFCLGMFRALKSNGTVYVHFQSALNTFSQTGRVSDSIELSCPGGAYSFFGVGNLAHSEGGNFAYSL